LCLLFFININVAQELHLQHLSIYLNPFFKRIANYVYRFFPLKEINNISIFQDAKPFKNDPLILALKLVANMCLLVEELNFIVSLNTSTPYIKESLLTSSHLRL
jgi:hypothetical protein